MFLHDHYQNAYVTRDLDRALELLRDRHGATGFKRIEVSFELKTAARSGIATVRLALGWVGKLQYELIEPVSGLVDVYRDGLPDRGSLLRFHHVCMRVHDWPRFRAGLEAQPYPVTIEGGTKDHLQFAYLDARESLGHYLEYCWMTPERWTAMGGQ